MIKRRKSFKSTISMLLVLSTIMTCSPGIVIANADTSGSSGINKLTTEAEQGTVLHAWNWSFNTISENVAEIKAAGYTSIQVSPIQQTKDDTFLTNTKWWILYQPINFEIGNAQLGTKSEFEAMVDAAHGYGLKVIVDIVSNHTGNNEGDGSTTISPKVTFKDDASYWHSPLHGVTDWDDRYEVTHGGIGLPDLNTSNPNVQNMIKNYLEECLESGVDGFRFDTAKHLELPSPLDEEGTSSDYWPAVLGGLTTKDGHTPFVYGEVLQGGADNFSGYTKIMDVTASNYGNAVRSIVGVGSNDSVDLNDANFNDYKNYNIPSDVDPSELVTWVESHDTYANDSAESTPLTAEQIKNGWALTASRAKSTPLYFNRPAGRSKLQGNIGDEGNSNWKDPDVVAINKFHNAMEAEGENITKLSNKIVMIERGDKGVVIVNLGEAITDFTATTALEANTYTNCATTGGVFTVSNGQITGSLPKGSTVLYEGGIPEAPVNLPAVSIDKENCSFYDTLTLTLHVKNAATGSYSINDGTETAYTDGETITIGAEATAGEKIKVTLKASTTDGEIAEEYVYTKKDENSVATVYFKKPTGWQIPYVYIYNELGENNGSFPGERMTKIDDNLYKYELKGFTDAKVVFNDWFYGGHKSEELNLSATGKMIYDSEAQTKWSASGDYEDKNVEQDEEEKSTAKVYFQKPAEWTTDEVNVYFYKTGASGPSWPGIPMEKVEGKEGLYTYTLPKGLDGSMVLFNTNGGTVQIPKDVGFKAPADTTMIYDNGWKEYLQGVSKVYFRKPSEDWNDPYVFVYDDSKNPQVNVAGEWPGIKMKEEVNGLYSYTLPEGYNDTKVVFNDNGSNQTPGYGNPGLVLKTDSAMIYDNGNLRDFTADDLETPEEAAVAGQGVTKVYFKNDFGWEKVKIYYWQEDGTSTAWPGVSMVDEGNNLYSYNLPKGYESAKIIFNNDGNGQQTVNLATKVGSTMEFASNGELDGENHLTGELVSKSKVYFKNTEGWASVKIHYWQDGGTSTTWPGESVVNEGDNLYSYTLPDGFETANVIFNNNGKGKQTDTVKADDKKTLIYVDGEWREFTEDDVPKGDTEEPNEPTDPDDNIEVGSKVYVKVPEGWNGIPNLHYWNTAGGHTEWPGIAMKDEGDGLYSGVIPKSFGDVTIIINDGSDKITDTEGKAEFDIKIGSFLIFENGQWKEYVEPTPTPEEPKEVSKTPTVSNTVYTSTTNIKGTAGANAEVILTVDEEVKYTTSAGAQVVTETKVEEKEIGYTTADKNGNWSIKISKQKKGTTIKVTAKEEGKLAVSIKVTVKKKSSSSSSSSSNGSSISVSGNITTVNSTDVATIEKELAKAATSNVKVNLLSKPIVSKSIFEALMSNKNKTLTLVGDNASWIFNGIDILANGLADIDTTIRLASQNAAMINNLVGGREVVNLSFAHRGLLPGKAKIQANVNSKYNDKAMYMYSYNLANNRLTLISPSVVVKDGIATFEITKGSDYILSETPVAGAVKEGWNQTSNGNWIFVKDENNTTGWIKDGANWYLTDKSGIMKTGWEKDSDGKWYYLSTSGAMKTGWLNDNGTWYYLGQSGDMLSNTSIDGYTLGADGTWIA